MTLRRRKGDGNWHNDAPIASVHHALYSLRKEFSDSGTRYLEIEDESGVLCCDWFRDGDSGGASSGTWYYQIKPEIVKILHDQHFVENKRVPQWGHTYKEPNKFVLSHFGVEELQCLNRETKEAALALFGSSKISPSPEDLKSVTVRGPSWKDEELFYELETQKEEKFEVFPALKKVERTKEKRVLPTIIPMTERSEIRDPAELLSMFKRVEHRQVLISAPDELRIDIYEPDKSDPFKKILTTICLYRIDPAAVVMLLWEGLISVNNDYFKHEPKPVIQYVLSERGRFRLRDLKEKKKISA